MDLNWCPVCEQHIPLAWESSLYCSDRCKKADALATHPALGYAYPADLQSFPRQKNSSYSPLPSPTLASSPNAYPSPPTSPMTNYVYNSGRISPPAFTLGHPAAAGLVNSDLAEMRRRSATGSQHAMTTTTTSAANKKGGFFW
ncbi:hypothetical protein EDD21DRAFT_414345 [Dissophora ornata]|nr:hypothetical protein BGZ58_009290 [Dissophora ornata]KAI8602043.1 hypothetical protein EDD21DRAFT_414345 [Dissophora ornata]